MNCTLKFWYVAKTNEPLLVIARSMIKTHGMFTFVKFGKCIFMHLMSNLVIYSDGQLQQTVQWHVTLAHLNE